MFLGIFKVAAVRFGFVGFVYIPGTHHSSEMKQGTCKCYRAHRSSGYTRFWKVYTGITQVSGMRVTSNRTHRNCSRI